MLEYATALFLWVSLPYTLIRHEGQQKKNGGQHG